MRLPIAFRKVEELCRDIVKFRAGNPTKAQLWDCIEGLGQEILVLRLNNLTQRAERWLLARRRLVALLAMKIHSN